MAFSNWHRALPVALLLVSTVAFGRDFTEEVERSIPLRAKGHLQISNNRGDIIVEGWSQDKVRLKARRRARAETETEAKRLFAAMDFRHRVLDRDIEISAEYGQGLTLEERLRERANPKTAMEMSVMAPANLPLRIWAVQGRVTVKSWKGPLEIRTQSGVVQIDSTKAESISVLCPACTMEIRETRGSLRAMGGSGPITITDAQGSVVYVETSDGPVRSERVEADQQLYVSKTGAVSVAHAKGNIEFNTQQSAVEIVDSSGFVSGRTASGNISIRMLSWQFSDKALIESASGKISLGLPPKFSGEIDARSAQGHIEVGFPLYHGAQLVTPQVSGDTGTSRSKSGTVGDGGELLRVSSEKGDIHISPYSP